MKIDIAQNTVNISGSISILEVDEILQKISSVLNKSTPDKLQVVIEENTKIKESTSIILMDSLQELENQNKSYLSVKLPKQINSTAQSIKKLQPTKYSKISLLLIDFGKYCSKIAIEFKDTISFVSLFLSEIKKITLSPKKFRLKETISQIDHTGIFAVGIVALVTFLIGIVIAYLMGNQLRYYGANIFVVDGVCVSMCRELSPILVAIVVAGRSGSAFAAQLGSMKLNHETEALEVMGLKSFQVLVIPRIIGLMISLPFLVLVGDFFGILGGMFISNLHLDVSIENFIERMHLALTPKQVFVGLSKAPVFALFIAAIGCRLGLNSEPNAVSIGKNTTKTVVHSIVSVILLNASAAIIFTQFGI